MLLIGGGSIEAVHEASFAAMAEFEKFCKSSIRVSGVEMEVRRNPTQHQTMAKPAYRRENSVIEIADRFDRALNEFIKMN